MFKHLLSLFLNAHIFYQHISVSFMLIAQTILYLNDSLIPIPDYAACRGWSQILVPFMGE